MGDGVVLILLCRFLGLRLRNSAIPLFQLVLRSAFPEIGPFSIGLRESSAASWMRRGGNCSAQRHCPFVFVWLRCPLVNCKSATSSNTCYGDTELPIVLPNYLGGTSIEWRVYQAHRTNCTLGGIRHCSAGRSLRYQLVFFIGIHESFSLCF